MRGRWGLTPRGVIAVVFDDTDRHNRVLQMFKKKPQRGCGFSEGAEKKRKRGSGGWWWGEITTRQNILGGEKCLKNCCGRELKRWYWDFLLPQLGFILFSNISHRKGAKKKKKIVWRWEGEDEVPPSPQNWDLTLKRHRPPWSIFHRRLPVAGLSPRTPTPHPPLWHDGPGEMPAALNHSDVFTDRPAISLSAARSLRNCIATDITAATIEGSQKGKHYWFHMRPPHTPVCTCVYITWQWARKPSSWSIQFRLQRVSEWCGGADSSFNRICCWK